MEANWESVSSILQVVGAGFLRLLLSVSHSLSLETFVLILLSGLKQVSVLPGDRKENILNVSLKSCKSTSHHTNGGNILAIKMLCIVASIPRGTCSRFGFVHQIRVEAALICWCCVVSSKYLCLLGFLEFLGIKISQPGRDPSQRLQGPWVCLFIHF